MRRGRQTPTFERAGIFDHSDGPDYPTIDHVIPLSKGGSHTWDNVKVACGECNCVVKGAKVLAS